MARAKRTDRAEIRRRYRAQLAAQEAAAEVEPADETPQPGSSGGARSSRATTESAPARPPGGIVYAFRAAFRPANIREDLAHLPVLLRSRAVLLPLVAIAATAIVFTATRGTELVSTLLAQYFLLPPPIGAIFIAGFFAPRASYLAGAIVGLAAALGLTIAAATLTPGAIGATGQPRVSPSPAIASAPAAASASPAASLLASPSISASASAAPSASAGASAAASPDASPAASAVPSPSPTPEDVSVAQVAAYSFVVSPLTGIFFASAAAWYRRFLKLASPNRAAQRGGNRPRPGSGTRGKPQRRR